MLLFLHISLAAVAVFLAVCTLLNLSKHPHWFIRLWDFPRVMTAAVAIGLAITYAILFHHRWYDWALQAALALVFVRQAYMIFPYTPIAHKAVKRASKPPGKSSLRLVISNVLMENREFDLWHRVIREADPDVIVALEVDAHWEKALEPLREAYPHVVSQVQDNYYGMVLYSRLKIDDARIRFLVQKDIPSIHATIQLHDGQHARLHALHPRPPEPINDQDSAPRDAELILMGKEIDKHQREDPTIVCGDLNDVAWSFTTQLFLRLSKLLDPRKGRGFYNSFNAKSRVFRFPLDHVFHSDEFKLISLSRLPYVGSDHFPMLVELSCEPESAREAQGESQERGGDREEANEIIEEQADREKSGEEHGHVAQQGGNRG
jgi:endonuclease/exonuclease/phosphatase (EEP) superfamily protein YafD